MKTIQTYIAGIVIIGIIIGITSSYAIGSEYSKATSIGELCKIAFNGDIDYNGKGCTFDEGLSDAVLLGDVNFSIKGKVYTSTQLQSLLDSAITKKYKKLGYEEGTPGMIKAKSRLYDALLSKIGNDFSKTAIQDNQQKRELYSGLYLIISVSKYRSGENYIEAKNKANTKNNTSTVYQENYSARISQEGFMSTGINQADVERIKQAKAKASSEEYEKLSDYEKQAKRYNVAYDGIAPSYNIHEKGIGEIQKLIDKVNEGPRITGHIGMQNGLIYSQIVDDYNIYIGLLIDGGLVNYSQDLVKETGFFRTYVGPFYGDTNGEWRNGTTNGKNAEKVLAYFGYSIDLNPLNSTYLELSYNESKNQARGQIDYIENIWK